METQVFRLTFGIFLVVALILPPSHTLENKTRPVEKNPKPPGTGTQVVTESELEKLDMKKFFSTPNSDYVISNYATDASSATEACLELSKLTKRKYNLAIFENKEEVIAVRSHLQNFDNVTNVWTAGERDENSKSFWNAANGTQLQISRKLLDDISQLADDTTNLIRKSRSLIEGKRRTTTSAPIWVTIPYGDRVTDLSSYYDDECDDNIVRPSECENINCTVTLPPCKPVQRKHCPETVTPDCIVQQQDCTAKCENCTVVVPPQCYAEPQPCTVTQGECKVTPKPCQVEHPSCTVVRPECESYQPPCHNITKPSLCTTRAPCIDDCEDDNRCDNCDDPKCKCRVTICQEEETICPPPITHCPPPIVTCPDPILNCTDQAIIECPLPEAHCPEPKVTCTEAQVICTSPVVNCPTLVSSCNRPNITCDTPEPECPPPVVVCDEPSTTCPPAPPSPKPCCRGCGCCYLSKDAGSLDKNGKRVNMLDFQKCRRKNHFICQAPKAT